MDTVPSFGTEFFLATFEQRGGGVYMSLSKFKTKVNKNLDNFEMFITKTGVYLQLYCKYKYNTHMHSYKYQMPMANILQKYDMFLF